MASTPPSLESLRVNSIREVNGLPPLETLSALPIVPTRVFPSRPATLQAEVPVYVAPVSVATPMATTLVEGETHPQIQALQNTLVDEPAHIPFDESNLSSITRILQTLPLESINAQFYSEQTLSNIANELVSTPASINLVAAPAPAVTTGSSRSPETEAASPPRGASPAQIVELSRSSAPIVSPVVVTNRSLSVPTSSPIPQYPSGLPVSIDTVLQKRTISTSETLSRKKGYYIVPWQGLFHYFKIPDIEESPGFFFTFKAKPATRKEGFVVVNKELYYVTLDDLKRGIVRKSRKVNVKLSPTYNDFITLASRPGNPAANGNSSCSVEAGKTEAAVDSGVLGFQAPDRSEIDGSIIEGFGLDVHQAADLAFKIQERALQDLISQEAGEDWELSETA